MFSMTQATWPTRLKMISDSQNLRLIFVFAMRSPPRIDSLYYTTHNRPAQEGKIRFDGMFSVEFFSKMW
jgi:hypothetical protein